MIAQTSVVSIRCEDRPVRECGIYKKMEGACTNRGACEKEARFPNTKGEPESDLSSFVKVYSGDKVVVKNLLKYSLSNVNNRAKVT